MYLRLNNSLIYRKITQFTNERIVSLIKTKTNQYKLLNIIFIEESNSLVMFQCSDQSHELIHVHTAHVKATI